MTVSSLPAPTSPKIVTGNVTGPNPYAAGGFTVDLSATFATVSYFAMAITTVGANLPPAHYEYALDSPSAGKVTVKVMRHRYDKVSSVDNVSGQPAGVTVQTTSGQTVAAEAAHTHGVGSYDAAAEAAHTHNQSALTAQAVDAVGGVGNATRVSAATGAGTSHDHALSGTSAAGSSHSHTDNNIYQHQHGNTQAETNAASVEMGSTNLSGTTWRYLAVGS